jgi:hypothetical protein
MIIDSAGMSAKSRAQKLNTKAVTQLNAAMAEVPAHRNPFADDKPDLDRIVDDVVAGKRPATLNEGSYWPAIIFFSVLAALLVASAFEKTAQWANAAWILIWLLFYLGPLVVNFFSETFSSLTTVGYNRPPPCQVSGCSHEASYIVNPTGHREVKLCHEHKTDVENRVRYAQLFEPKVARAIVAAYRDLAEATRLDPSSSQIGENLKQARSLAEIVLGRKLG